jgi:hypothetical protein
MILYLLTAIGFPSGGSSGCTFTKIGERQLHKKWKQYTKKLQNTKNKQNRNQNTQNKKIN